MSGPRMGNVGQMNGNRRPNISRMDPHDRRQAPSHHDHRQIERQMSHHDRQNYSENRQNYSENRQNYSENRHSYSENRQNYSESRPAYSDNRQNYSDNRQSFSQNRQQVFSEERQPVSHIAMPHHVPQSAIHSQHDELIKYIYDSWSKIEMDRGSRGVMYYQENENLHLKDFHPVDLEAYYNRRHQNHHQPHHS